MKKLLLAVALVVLDQVLKWYLQGKNFFIFKYSSNYGAAFGLMEGWTWLFILVALVVIAVILYYYKKVPYKYGLIFLLAGTVGNVIDRIAYGFVRDFVSIWIFPVFNLADMFNWIGVILIVYALWKK